MFFTLFLLPGTANNKIDQVTLASTLNEFSNEK